MGYTKETVKGISWIGGFRIASRSISYVKLAIILRILSPDQFGLFVIASLVLAFVEIITETGINTVLVQEDEEIDSYINTAWIVSVIRGLIIALMVIAFAPFIAGFFQSPHSNYLLLLISVVPLVKGFINPSIIKLQKELMFNKEFYLRTFIFFIDAIVAVLVTLITKSPAGIIWGLIIGAVLEVTISFMIVKPVPKLIFQVDIFKKVFNRGKWVTLASVFNYLFHNADDIVVGKILGISSLGLYDFAYKFSMLPITEVGDVVSKVTFPVYTKIAKDTDRLKKAYLKTLIATAILVLPLGVILFSFPHIIIKIFGDQWGRAASVFQILAVFGVVRAILNSTSPLFLAMKKQEYVSLITLVSFVVLAFAIIPFVQKFGINGAAYSVLISTFCTIPLIIYFLIKIFKNINNKS